MTQIVLDSYLIDGLLPDFVGHDRKPASFIVYLYLYVQASQRSEWAVHLSHQAIADATGLSRSAVQSSLSHLQRRELVNTTRAHPTAVPKHRVLRPWLRLRKGRDG